MAGVLPMPGHVSQDFGSYRQPDSNLSHGSDRTAAAYAVSGVMPGSVPAGYHSQIPTQHSAHGVDLGSQRSLPGGFMPPTAAALQPGGPMLPSAQAYSPPGSYQGGSYQIPSSHKSMDIGSYPIGSQARIPGTDRTMAAGVRPDTVHGLHEHSIGSYPAGGLPSMNPGALPTMPGGIPAHSMTSMHGSQRGGPPLPPPGYGPPDSGSYMRPGSGGYGPPQGSHGSMGGMDTRSNVPSYPNDHFMNSMPPGSANSAGTEHGLHPGYGPDHGYSPGPSQQLPTGHQAQPQGWQGQRPGQVVGKLSVRIIAATSLKNTDLGVVPGESSDPFCVIKLGNQEHSTEVIRTRPVNNKLSPVFNSQHFEFAVPNEDDVLKIEIYNANQFYAHDALGRLTLHLHNIVSCPGEVQTRKDDLKDGGNGQLEYELYYVPPERMVMNARAGQEPKSGQVQPFVDLQVQHKPPQHQIPLPDFTGFGPAAFAAPPPELEVAPVGEMKKKAEYESWACHLGQYDYDGGPVYFPDQEPVDRHAWKNDPFYRALEDSDRSLAEASTAADGKDPFGKWRDRDVKSLGDQAGKCRSCGSTLMSDARFCRKCGKPRDDQQQKQLMDRKQVEMGLWQKDPFHDWLLAPGQEAGSPGEGMANERVQEARRQRQMLALPTFKDDPKRFEDNREYVGMHDVARNTRPRHNQQRYEPNHAEIQWKDDAFYGWLPDHGGPSRPEEHSLHRPLENARMARLPSFSEDRFLGLSGKGFGVLKVWVKYAKNIQYDPQSRLVGRPSALVQLSCRGGDAQHVRGDRSKGWNRMDNGEQSSWTALGWNQNMWDTGSQVPSSESKKWEQLNEREKSAAQSLGLAESWDPKLKATKKLTPTIEHENNPVWNTGAFQFEVQSQTDTLSLELIDLLGQDRESNVFLGRVNKSVSELLQKIAPRYRPDSQEWPGALRQEITERLQGTGGGSSGELTFMVSFQPYAQQAMKSLADHSYGAEYSRPGTQNSMAGAGYSQGGHSPSHGHSSAGAKVIVISKIKASGLNSQGSGMFGRLVAGSAYVKAKLNTQTAQRAQRTEAKSTSEDPLWEMRDRWRFNVEPGDSHLELSVYSEAFGSDDAIVGSLNIPVHDIIDNLQGRKEEVVGDLLQDERGTQTQARLDVTLQWENAR